EAATAMCTRYGMTKRQQERCSRVHVDDIDDALLATWEAAAVDVAPGYWIEQWEGPVPATLLEAWCTAAAAMEDAPLDDVEYDAETRRPAEQQTADESLQASGFVAYRTLALGPGSEPAGMTQLVVHQERPEIGYQGDTGVLAAHRGHGIGRWLKAANYRQTSAAQPDLGLIETYNAQSNPWMLEINMAMGFRPHHVYDAYQAPIATVAAAVGV
ncbi:MAG: hypothetical protein OEV40_12035, partial [Acidimicrobiia bacterium]|nr:hypothetical protein [Acidimicrobiia bacterium]